VLQDAPGGKRVTPSVGHEPADSIPDNALYAVVALAILSLTVALSAR